jgi:hypothetical protein
MCYVQELKIYKIFEILVVLWICALLLNTIIYYVSQSVSAYVCSIF